MPELRRTRPVAVIVLAVLVPSAAILCRLAHADDAGLVAHYCFDTDTADRAVDSSGNGFDGTISGAVHVDSPHGKALRFDGIDDFVEVPVQPGLILQGDITIAAWINADTVADRNRMIFGDAAGLAVNRNYNLRLDRGGALRFEYGNGDAYGAVISEPVLETGQWQHVAVVCEYPRFYLYLDGECIQSGRMSLPVTPTDGASRRIGGWFAGFFKGDIDEIRLYNRAISEREILAHAKGTGIEPHPWAELDVEFHYRDHAMVARVLCSAIAADHARAEFALRNASGKLALPCRVEHLTETSPGADRWLSTIRMSTRDLATGNHQLQAVARDLQSGAILAEDTFGFMYPGDAPAWLGSQEGISEEVLPPFTPLEATDDDGVHAISCWGRSYQFGRDPFISQIISQSQHLLAGPIRLQATIDGEKQSWTCRELNASTDSPAKHTLEQELESDAAGVNVSTSIEYDGFIRQDWELTVADGGQVQALTYEIPLNPETARYSYWWPQPRSGALSADLATEFKPIVWLGSEDVGLQWVCESDEHWHSADPERAIEIIRGEDEVLLRLNLVSQPVELPAGGMLTYSFGLHATPVKPMERDACDYRIVRHPWYGQSFQLHEKMVGETPALEHFREKGVKALINWRMWDAFAYVAPLGHEEEFRELVKTWHQYGIGVVPYTVSFLLSENAPEALFFRNEMTRAPLTEFPIVFPGLPRETDYHTCHNSIWSDYIANGIARLIDEYDVDGIYLDTTSTPWPCNSELHGCGYPRPDGTRAPTYPVFAARTNLKRLYTVVKSRKPEGIIDLHVYDCMLAPALSFVTTYWNGEQLPKGHAFKPEVLPLDRFRTEFMGYNWGPPADLLYYCLGDYEKSVAIALLHDVPVRSEKLPDLEVQSALWKLRERFGVQQAEWMPYWRNSDVVTVTPEDCYASLFNHLDGRALAYVSNLSREDANVTVRLDLNALGLKPPLTAADGLTGEALAMPDGTLTVPMPSQSSRTVWVEGKR